MPRKPGESRVEILEAGDPVGDLGPSLGDEPWQLFGCGRAMSGVAPARDLARIAERHVEPTEVDQQTQVLDVGLAVLAIVVGLS